MANQPDGAVQQSNFHDYPVLRMSDVPQIHTRLIVSDHPPTGMGEFGVVTVAPAIGNAVACLTPQAPQAPADDAERVKEALNA